jgi:hypothetical protein
MRRESKPENKYEAWQGAGSVAELLTCDLLALVTRSPLSTSSLQSGSKAKKRKGGDCRGSSKLG